MISTFSNVIWHFFKISPKPTRRRLFGLLIIFFFCCNLSAQWSQTSGPEGATTDSFLEVGSTIFLSTRAGGIYKSIDSGSSWSLIVNGLPVDPYVYEIIESNGVLYLSVAKNGIYKSEDLGETWHPSNAGIESRTFYTLTADGSDLYASLTWGGLYHSPDGGNTWVRRDNGISDFQISAMATFNSNLYVGNHSGVLYESKDKGESFTAHTITNPLNGVSAMVSHGNDFYVAIDGKVFRTSDNLNSWVTTNINSNSIIMNMGVSADSVFLTASNGRIFYTKNQGSDYSLIQSSRTNYNSQDVLFLGDRILLATLEGVYKSLDHGASWTSSQSGLRAFTINTLAGNDQVIFAGTEIQGTFKSVDNGVTWTEFNAGLTGSASRHPDKLLVIENLVFLVDGVRVYRSPIGQANWTTLQTTHSANLAFDNGTLVTARNDQGIYISEDLGSTWELTEFNGVEEISGIISIDIDGNSIVIGDRSGKIIISTDKGISWTDISIPTVETRITKLLFEQGTLYASSLHGIHRSEDQGATWARYAHEISVKDFTIADNKILAATVDGIFLGSKNRNEWEIKNTGMEEMRTNSVELTGSKLFAGSHSSSVWSRELVEFKLTPKITGVHGSNVIKRRDSLAITIDDLILDNPDSNIPNDAVLNIKTASNFEVVQTNYIKPDDSFLGDITVPLSLTIDGTEGQIFNAVFTVVENVIPSITATVNGLTTPEETPVLIELDMITVEDSDNDFPTDFELIITESVNYTVESNIVTPSQDFSGTLNLVVAVHDGLDISETAILELNVSPVNDIPVITGVAQDLLTDNETPLEIRLEDLIVVDPDNDYPADFTLTAEAGDNYTLQGTSITSVPDFTGTIHVPVSVNDGIADSEVFNVPVIISPVASLELSNISRQLKIFPNPSASNIKVILDNTNYASLAIKVLNSKGREVMSGDYQKKEELFQKEIDISLLPPGIYLVDIVQDKKFRAVKKIIKL